LDGTSFPIGRFNIPDRTGTPGRSVFGALLESFVFAEIAKLAGWFDPDRQICHYRDKDQNEVDVVIENAAGEIVGIEVKAGATVDATLFGGLRRLAAICGKRLRCGMVLYNGDAVLPFGRQIFAAPISILWSCKAT
jgi:predicted AAA+ superfamily ATPase